MLATLEKLLGQWRRQEGLPIWYDPAYRLPIAEVEGRTGIEPRRADFVAWFLIQSYRTTASNLRNPTPIRYEDLALVHDLAYLGSLAEPSTLAAILGVAPHKLPVDEVLRTMRLACGGTLAAARYALAERRPALNLLGGFHHAKPDRGADLCPLNDVAVALAVLRQEGFKGLCAIVDLDAHPPDGTAVCLASDPSVWIGSITPEPAPLPSVHTYPVPVGANNARYRAAVEALLGELPRAELTFVIAGGDVLAGDREGALALDLRGVRRRDLAIARALEGAGSVWLPGGGYHRESWKSLAGTALVLIEGALEPIAEHYDPMGVRFAAVSEDLFPKETWFTADDLAEVLPPPEPRRALFLGTYTAEGLEVALARFGVLAHLRRIGYDFFRVVVEPMAEGDRMRLFGQADGQEHLLVECVLAREMIGTWRWLYVHWMLLQNPRADESKGPRLPGQEYPGLGLAREAGEMLVRIAERLKLDGVAFRPAWFHTAYAARSFMRFIDPVRQGRFEALLRDLRHLKLSEASLAVSAGRVAAGGEVYHWEPDVMALWLRGAPLDEDAVRRERERIRFELLDQIDQRQGPR